MYEGHVCDIEHIIYILCKNAYGHFAILVTRNIYDNVKLHFYNRENISYELFYKKLFILSYYRRKSQHFEKYLDDTMLCMKVMCVTLSTLYISYVRMHMATLQYLLQEIFMIMSSCISTIERIFLMNFSIRNYSSYPIIGESHNICVSCSCPWAVPFSFSFVHIF